MSDHRSHSQEENIPLQELLQLGLNGESDVFSTLAEQPLSEQDMPVSTEKMKDYTFIRKISNGGMGMVYLAWQESLERFVAVKFLLPELNAMPQFVERFRREAKAAASLKHPNIVTVHEVGMVDDRVFFSMPFVEGRDLSDVIKEGPVEWRRAAKYCQTIASTVEFAHSRWVLHRDLKPSNVLIDLQDEPHLTDFGLAGKMEVRSHLTLTGHVLGSPSYLSPEQAAGQVDDLGPGCDVYSMGVILYECLTGQAPFRGSSVHEMLRRIREEAPRRPRTFIQSIPKDLETICLKCLEKDPARRYATAALLADDLSRCLNGEPIRAKNRSRVEHSTKWIAKHPKLSFVFGAVIALSVAISAFAVLEMERMEDAYDVKTQSLQERSAELFRTYLSLAASHEEDARYKESANYLTKALELVKDDPKQTGVLTKRINELRAR